MQTNFGFQKVDFSEKTGLVRDVFHRVASKYDLMNDLMSLGVHRLWKSHFIHKLPLSSKAKVLDLAGGTGDIALRLATEFPYLDLDITVCDLTPDMVTTGRDRALDSGVSRNTHWCAGNGEVLPFADESFAACTIVFGLRNVAKQELALQEIHRVLKPGGHFLCMEFSQIEQALLKKIYQGYLFSILPRIGRWVAGDEPAYRYLAESIDKFHTADKLAHMCKTAGFDKVEFEYWMQGIVAVHSGVKI